MNWWRRRGLAPGPLPEQDIDPTGRYWLNLSDNPAGRLACGWEEAPPIPAFDPQTHQLSWSQEIGNWELEDIHYEITPARLISLLTEAQRSRMRLTERQARAVSAEDFSNPENATLLRFEDSLEIFRGLSIVDTKSSAVQDLLVLMQSLGIIGLEDAQRITNNREP